VVGERGGLHGRTPVSGHGCITALSFRPGPRGDPSA
jgi:hypothetical protein